MGQTPALILRPSRLEFATAKKAKIDGRWVIHRCQCTKYNNILLLSYRHSGYSLSKPRSQVLTHISLIKWVRSARTLNRNTSKELKLTSPLTVALFLIRYPCHITYNLEPSQYGRTDLSIFDHQADSTSPLHLITAPAPYVGICLELSDEPYQHYANQNDVFQRQSMGTNRLPYIWRYI